MNDSEKIVSLESLVNICGSLKNEGESVVLCHGTFDLLHVGHIKHLQAAKNLGDILIVTVTADEYVNKGPDRPVFNHHLRAENLSALGCVSYVAIIYEATSIGVLEAIKPDIYVKGDEYKDAGKDFTGNISLEKQTVEKHGGRIEYTEEVTFSSSKLLNEYFEVFEPQTKKFVDDIKLEYSTDYIFGLLDLLKPLKVAVIGDGIIDEYHYVDLLGQSGKGNFQSARYKHKESFAGGAFAVANHIAGFAGHVTLISGLGHNNDDEQYVNSKLKKNISAQLFKYTSSETLRKRRYVDCEMNKMFEIYFAEAEPMDVEVETRVIAWLVTNLKTYDVVIVPDFGNGFITQKMVKIISQYSKFLAVNTQINSGNRGYHVVTRYPKANYISINEPEIRMAAHDKHSSLDTITQEVSRKLGVAHAAVTRGVKGVKMYDSESDNIYAVPALSTKVVDRIGAGDAFLSVSALCLGAKINSRIAALLGNIAAALNVQVVCNREPVESVSVKKYVTTLLK